MRLKYIFVSFWFFCITLLSAAQNLPEQPMPPRLVNDLAHVFSNEEALALEQKLLAYNDSTSTQIAVVTVKDLQGMDKAMFATELAEKWHVGQKGKDNGILILLKPKMPRSKGQVYIAVGYGLEAFIPDATTKKIVAIEMIPYFKQGQMFAGVNAAVDTIFKLLMGEFTADQYVSSSSDTTAVIIFIVLMIIIFFVIFGRKNNGGGGQHFSSGDNGLLLWMLLNGLGGGSGSRGQGFGGGFGGGNSGGFGGFGGGSFGGGGAGGSW